MQLLIAHGDTTSRLALRGVMTEIAGPDLNVIEARDGKEALRILLDSSTPTIAVVNWDLPEVDGPELCRLVRAYHEAGPPYIILLARSDYRLAVGLEAGADDCVHTPAQGDELRARVNVGRRFASLPWDRVMRTAQSDADRWPAETATLAAECDPDDVGIEDEFSASRGGGFELAAQRSIDGDDLVDGGKSGSGGCSLESLLVAQ